MYDSDVTVFQYHLQLHLFALLNCNSIFSWRTLLMLVIHQEYLHSFCSLKWLVSENHKNEFSAQHYRFASLAVSIMPELCCFGKLPVHYFLSMQ